MRPALGFFLAGLVCAILQAGIFPRFLPVFARPDLFILLLVCLSLSQDTLRGAFIAWGLGAIKDVFSGQTLGLYGFVFLITFFFIKGTERRLNTESSLLLVFLVFAGVLIEGGLAAATLLILDDVGRGWQIILRHIPAQALVSSGVAWVLLLLAFWLQRRTGLRQIIPGLR
ncbi:rod shape-determining protein MreD [Geoalkalibacter halelectricus]|uniref:Rod shape-determining protein MreD n=1 Tax=Geoalkalibacter halelectricus TaxID=2847045 RepID=A0ABY5ZTR8_9BACT|nr:rod shape-determining protein MreD [Geoalkalibacter halelectricus]MDO3376723.1 rod shape-determining protein MreD [Geoalkalibacter halelectricus]UWZ81325.1 rod shape-determining protein MreD [Geoalkalibacter halelectricus]